jgi:membrane-associated phospholipid phosphatase
MYCAGLKPLKLVFQICAAPSLLPLPLATLFLLRALWRRWQGQAATGLWLTASLATIAAAAAKDELKFLFGRPWPFAWLDYGLYAFHPGTDNFLYGAFPSGHTAYVAAPLWVLWCRQPRWRVAYGAVTGSVMLGLVGANYHYVSDVLAGLLVGMAAGQAAMVFLDA